MCLYSKLKVRVLDWWLVLVYYIPSRCHGKGIQTKMKVMKEIAEKKSFAAVMTEMRSLQK
jgi:hypothetical protein